MWSWFKWASTILLAGFLSAHLPAAEGDEVPERQGALELQNVQKALNIPAALARVTDAYWPDTGHPPEYFLVQDIHRHSQVQAQIAALIQHGHEQWGVNKVFMEGAFADVDLAVFHRIPRKTQGFLLERLVNEGSLSGPELAAIHIMEEEWRNPPVSPFQLFGLEDPALYRQNVLAYQSVITSRDRALEALIPIKRLHETMHLTQPNDLMEQLRRTEALLRLRLTPSEYDAYIKDRALIPSTSAIDPAVHAAEEFYQLAQERSRVFLDMAARKVPASTSPRILVVGGFHTACMAASLRRAGRSFVILSPAVITARPDDDPYEKNLLETANVMAETLAPASH